MCLLAQIHNDEGVFLFIPKIENKSFTILQSTFVSAHTRAASMSVTRVQERHSNDAALCAPESP